MSRANIVSINIQNKFRRGKKQYLKKKFLKCDNVISWCIKKKKISLCKTKFVFSLALVTYGSIYNWFLVYLYLPILKYEFIIFEL